MQRQFIYWMNLLNFIIKTPKIKLQIMNINITEMSKPEGNVLQYKWMSQKQYNFENYISLNF